MKFLFLLLLAAFVANCSAAVNGKKANEQDLPAVKPTRAPLLTSTAAPTKAPQGQVSPTVKPANEKDSNTESFPIELPATVDHVLEGEESKPLAVTGFITQNGNIYEIENTHGIGKIEARQANNLEQHICNYGSVLVYSDLPCEKVTNIKIREVEEKPSVDLAASDLLAMQQIKPTEDTEKRPNNNNLNHPNKPAQNASKKPAQNRPSALAQNRPNRPAQKPNNKPAQNRPKKPAQNPNNKPAQNRPNKPAPKPNKKPSQNRPNKNQLTRPNQRPSNNGQKRPTQNGQKRPNINDLTRPVKNGQKRPANNKNRRLPQSNQHRLEEEEYYDDDELYFQGNQRRNQAQQFIYDYDDY